MPSLKHVLAALAALLVLPLVVTYFASEAPDQPDQEVASVAPLKITGTPERSPTAKGYPELFVEIHHNIRASEDGRVHYPVGYQIHELQKAVAALKHQQQTLNWQERGPGNIGGRTRPLLIDPDDPLGKTWLAGAVGGGLWRTRDSGETWVHLTDYLPSLAVSALAMSPSNHDILYMGTGEGFGNHDAAGGAGIFKSYDRGQSWEHLLSTAADTLFRFVNRLAVDPAAPDIVVAATNHGIYRTTDGGDSWTETYSRTGVFGTRTRSRIQDLQAQPGNFNTMIAGENPGGILRSTDGGQTWSYSIQEEDILGGSRRIELAFAPSDPAIAYASVELAVGGSGLLRSDDGGATWENTVETSPFPISWLDGQGWYNNSIAVHPYAPDTIFLGGVHLWRTTMTGDKTELKDPVRFQVSLGDQHGVIINYLAGLGNRLDALVLSGVGYPQEFTDIEEPDYSSVEIRYGQGTQMAHRFTSIDSTLQDLHCFIDPSTGEQPPYRRNEYQDYVEVPFTAWDIDSGRQLAVSFRDSGRDSTFNLMNVNTSGPCDQVSNEQLFVHKYDYDPSAPHDSLAQDGGLTRGMLYMVLPFIPPPGVWNPDDIPAQTTRISYVRMTAFTRDMDRDLDPRTQVHVDHHAIIPLGIDQADDKYWVFNTNDGGVSYSTDKGATFLETDNRFAGYNTSQFYGVDKRPNVDQYVGGMQDNGSWMSLGNPDGQRRWLPIYGADGFDAIWNSRDQDKIITTLQFNLFNYTTNRGADWTFGYTPGEGIFATSMSSSPHAPDTLYIIGQLGVWRSADWAQTWTLASLDSAWAPTHIGKVRASLATDSVVWAGYGLDDYPTVRTLWYSTDAGETFSPAALPAIPNAPRTITSGLATHPTEVGTAYALFSRYQYPKILETTDFGQTWQDISGYSESTNGVSVRGFPDVSVYDLLVMPHAPHVMWAATDAGLFQTKSRGKEWNYTHNGLPAVSVYRIKSKDDEIVVATHGRGVWTVPWAEVDVSVDDDRTAELPASFSLEQNYPNPFNASTAIRFSVPEESRIRLTIFDVLGRRVAVLTDQSYAVGVHEILWNASAFASGVYFYRMEVAGKLIQTQKMTLLK